MTQLPGDGVPRRVFWLTAGTFAIGTDAFVVAGVLPAIATSLRVEVAAAGQLVTVFAIAYAVLSPLLATATGNWPRRRVLLTALGVFVLGNVATALAPTYGLVLAARMLAAAGASMFTPIAGVAAAALAGPKQRAQAIAAVALGLTVSSAIGVPLGILLGGRLDWRATIWFVAGLGVLAAAGIALWFPSTAAASTAGLAERLRPLRRPAVLITLAATVAFFTGVYMVYTYVSVIIGPVTGGPGTTAYVAVLFVYGCAATAGNLLTGRLTDRFGARPVLVTVGTALVIDFALLPISPGTLPTTVAAMVVFGVAAWGITVPQQHRLIATAPSAAAPVVSLNASCMYLTVGLSGGIGAATLRLGSPTLLAWTAAGFVAIGLACIARRDRSSSSSAKVPAPNRETAPGHR